MHLRVWSGLWSRAASLLMLLWLPVGTALLSGRGGALLLRLRRDG